MTYSFWVNLRYNIMKTVYLVFDKILSDEDSPIHDTGSH